MSSPSKILTPVEAGKVGVFYDAASKVISHYAKFPQKGTIVSAMAVLVADNESALKEAIAKAGLIERK
jgi:4-hydroxyphenylpyruvate dioxygenase-like putative hemolysin